MSGHHRPSRCRGVALASTAMLNTVSVGKPGLADRRASWDSCRSCPSVRSLEDKPCRSAVVHTVPGCVLQQLDIRSEAVMAVPHFAGSLGRVPDDHLRPVHQLGWTELPILPAHPRPFAHFLLPSCVPSILFGFP